MQVHIKKFGDMAIKSSGIEIDVSDPKGKHIGDLIVTSTTLIWCEGKKRRENGIPVTWNRFIKMMNDI